MVSLGVVGGLVGLAVVEVVTLLVLVGIEVVITRRDFVRRLPLIVEK